MNFETQSRTEKVTVVTVVFNAVTLIEATIRSVLSQDYDNIEYIVVDGGSSDGTKEVIDKYVDEIDFFICEPDDGIYDAMNKGISLGSGNFFNFMNAGDVFLDQSVVTTFVESSSGVNAGFFYGDTSIGYKTLRHKPNIGVDDMAYGMPVCHQSVFFRKSSELRYEKKYRICADQELLIRYCRAFGSGYKMNQTICRYLLGGVSSQNLLKITMEKIEISDCYKLPKWKPIYSAIISLLARGKNRLLRRS